MSSTSGYGFSPVCSRRRSHHLAPDDEAVTEIIGSILMVAMTVLVSMGLVALLVLSDPGPNDPLHATLAMELDPGADGDWATGNERVRLVHQGGEPIPLSTTRITLEIDGQAETFTDGTAPVLDHTGETAFDDDQMRIGEVWETPDRLLPMGREVHVNLVTTQGDGAVAWSSSARIGTINCDTDVTAPVVQTWTQTPDDVTTSTTGDVTVRVTILDACENLDTSTDPHLEYRVNDGTDPAFTDTGDMTPQGNDQWEAAIPDQTWSIHVGEDLEYKVTGMADTEGNTDDSNVQTDTIQLAGTETYVTTPFIDNTEDPSKVGEATNDDAARSADDGGAEARLEEGANGTISPTLVADTYDAQAATITGSFTPGDEASAADDTYDSATGPSPDAIRYPLANEAGAPGTVVSVVLKAEVHGNDRADAFYLRPCLSGTCGDQSGDLNAPLTDDTIEYNVTTLRPGGGAWSVSDISDLEIEVDASGSSHPVFTAEYHIDHVYAEVKYRPAGGTAYNMNIHASVDGLSGSTHVLDLRYRASQDTFELHVWDGSQWNKRADLTASTSTRLTYTLTPTEVDSGTVELRFIDSTTGTSQGTLFLGYLRVVSP